MDNNNNNNNNNNNDASFSRPSRRMSFGQEFEPVKGNDLNPSDFPRVRCAWCAKCFNSINRESCCTVRSLLPYVIKWANQVQIYVVLSQQCLYIY